MRTQLELWQVVKDNFDDYFYEGLCILISRLYIKGIISMDEGTESESRIGNINEREIYYYGFKPDQNDRLFFSCCMWGYVRKKKALSGWVLKGDTVIAG